MAQVTEAIFKQKMADFAAALTDAMADDTDNGMAAVLTDPRHPLRDIEKLFNFDPQTGQVTANTDYIGKTYEGKKPSVSNPFDQISDPPI